MWSTTRLVCLLARIWNCRLFFGYFTNSRESNQSKRDLPPFLWSGYIIVSLSDETICIYARRFGAALLWVIWRHRLPTKFVLSLHCQILLDESCYVLETWKTGSNSWLNIYSTGVLENYHIATRFHRSRPFVLVPLEWHMPHYAGAPRGSDWQPAFQQRFDSVIGLFSSLKFPTRIYLFYKSPHFEHCPFTNSIRTDRYTPLPILKGFPVRCRRKQRK